jgi:hypothetical protein
VPDIRLDGLAFTTPSDWTYSEGTVRCFRDGAAETIWEPDTLFGPGFGSYGVSYSLGGTRLLCAGGIWLVTRDGSEVSVEVIGGVSSGGSMSSGGDETGSWSATGSGEAAVIELSPTERSESQELLRCDGLLWMNRVAYDESNNRIWLARQANGLGDVNLWTAQPHASELVPVPLADSFGGDFAVSPDGSTIVYVGTWQVPAKVIMRTPDSETDLALGLATAYSPVFSPEGDKVCLVGSQALDGETAIWIFDADGGNCREIASTRGLAPTFPVFSPDGQRIAFRSWKLGDIWTVVVDRGELTRYAINAADAPIAW